MNPNDIIAGMQRKGISTRNDWNAAAGVSKRGANIVDAIDAIKLAAWFASGLCEKDRGAYIRLGPKRQAAFVKQLCASCKKRHEEYLDKLEVALRKEYGDDINVKRN